MRRRRAGRLGALAGLGVGVLLGALLGASCESSSTTVDPPVPPAFAPPSRPACAGRYAGLPTVLGHLSDARLTEVSGVVASWQTDDLYWVHNDSGDDPIVYALGADGRSRGELRLPITAPDIEDIAIASCPTSTSSGTPLDEGPCLYVADTGNNAGTRTDTAIYVFPEPALDGEVFDLDVDIDDVRRLDVSTRSRLPAGVDSEALVVLPDASALLLFEKIDETFARVFAVDGPFALTPPDASEVEREPNTLRLAGSVSTESPSTVALARMITGADIHPNGARFLVRTYSGVFEGTLPERDEGSRVQLEAVALTTVTFGPFTEPQGEAIAYDLQGTGVLTISEARDKAASEVPVNLLVCE